MFEVVVPFVFDLVATIVVSGIIVAVPCLIVAVIVQN